MGVRYRLGSAEVKRHPPSSSTAIARRLRRDATDSERKIWLLLRAHFPTARFRRQVPIRHYIVDFVSHRARLVIEIDGGQHSPEVDAHRTAAIEAEGYRIVRFWNNEVLENPEGCMVLLGIALGEITPTQPSPIKGEGFP